VGLIPQQRHRWAYAATPRCNSSCACGIPLLEAMIQRAAEIVTKVIQHPLLSSAPLYHIYIAGSTVNSIPLKKNPIWAGLDTPAKLDPGYKRCQRAATVDFQVWVGRRFGEVCRPQICSLKFASAVYYQQRTCIVMTLTDSTYS